MVSCYPSIYNSFTIVDDIRYQYRCDVIGGGSTVDPRIYLHGDDVTSGFSVTRSRTTVGARCMRRERYVTSSGRSQG